MNTAKATRIERELPPEGKWKLFDLKLGYALLGDRRVPLRSKLAAFAIALGAVAIVGLLELPVEEIVAVGLPIFGVIGDLALDGFEAIFGPILLACLLLPHLAPADIVERIRAERSPAFRSAEGPIIDI